MKKLTALCFSLALVQNCNSGKKSSPPPHSTKNSNLNIDSGAVTPSGAEPIGAAKQANAAAKATAKAAKAATKAEARAAKAAARAARKKAKKGLGLTADETAAKQNIATMAQDASTNGVNHVDKVFSEQEVDDMVDLLLGDVQTDTLTVTAFISTVQKIAGFTYSNAALNNFETVLTAICKNYEKSDNTLDDQDLTDLLNGWDTFIANYAKSNP